MKNFTSCYKDKKFIQFFFKNLRKNTTARYSEEFPYISLCGRERNFLRCDDQPIVFTQVMSQIQENNSEVALLSYAHAAELLTFKFMPGKVFMHPETGRVYHPAPFKVGNVGLVRSKLAMELSKCFEYRVEDNYPTHFRWNGKAHALDHEWYYKAKLDFENEENKE